MIRGPKCKALRFLSRREVKDIHMATLEVLEHVGMHSDSAEILKVFQSAGADVNFKEKRVKIPQHLIQEALQKTPKQYVLHGRNPKFDILLENGRVYFGQGGTPVPYIKDLETGKLRRPMKSDVADAARLGDGLSSMSFIMNIAGAFDVPYEVEYVHEFDALFRNTEKPIIYSAPGAECTRTVFSMASAIVGGSEELRKRPILSIYCETSAPLSFSIENDNMIECAEAGVPITLGPVPILGATAPITLAGANVIGNSEALAAITLVQLVRPHTPVNYAAWSLTLDPKTGVGCYATPQNVLSFGVMGQLADYYDLPSFGLGGPVDSKTADAQAGCEMALGALTNALSGVNLIHDSGYLASGSVGSMEMAVICDETIGYILRIVRGITIDDESLAVDLIRNVGPRGQFFSQKHTLKYLEREIYIPRLFDRQQLDSWVKGGMKDISQVAREKAQEILKEHWPERLPMDVEQRLSEILKTAEKEMTKT